MQSSLDRELRDRLLDYLRGVETLDQFKHWLAAVTWNIDNQSDGSVVELVYEVQLALADQSSGLTTEAEMREELSRLARLTRVA